jgi:transmembrane sensor
MSKHLEIEQQAAGWLARKHGDGWSAAEQAQLDLWVGLSTAHRVAWLRLEAARSGADLPAACVPMPASQPDRDEAANDAQRRPLPRFSQWRIAAALLVTVGAGAGLLAVGAYESEVRYETALGAHQTHALKDGSKLTLNTATLLRARVSQRDRTVWLDKGEAFFDIAHDTAHPFVVISGANRITVLGTKFSVRREDGGTKVVVVDGRVQVENAQIAGQSPVILGKHQKVVATSASMLKTDESVARIDQVMSWREGKLVFDQVTLDYAAGEFNRYNKKKLVLADAKVAKMRIGGRFDVGNVKGFAGLLQRGFGLDVRETDDQITIASTGREAPVR